MSSKPGVEKVIERSLTCTIIIVFVSKWFIHDPNLSFSNHWLAILIPYSYKKKIMTH